jgi:hypothetical protein
VKWLAGVSALAAMAIVADAHAGFISAYGWVANQTDLMKMGASPETLMQPDCHVSSSSACTFDNADVIFTTNFISFDNSDASANDIGTWLGTTPDTGPMYNNNVDPTRSMEFTIWEFMGTASFSQSTRYRIKYQDGATLTVNNDSMVFNVPPCSDPDPGPTSFDGRCPYKGPDGNFNFDFIYANYFVGNSEEDPAAFVVQFPLAAVLPEPTSLALLGSALGGISLAIRRRRCL